MFNSIETQVKQLKECGILRFFHKGENVANDEQSKNEIVFFWGKYIKLIKVEKGQR